MCSPGGGYVPPPPSLFPFLFHSTCCFSLTGSWLGNLVEMPSVFDLEHRLLILKLVNSAQIHPATLGASTYPHT